MGATAKMEKIWSMILQHKLDTKTGQISFDRKYETGPIEEAPRVSGREVEGPKSFAKDEKVAKRFGNIKCCAQALKLAGEGGQKGGAGKKEAPKEAAKKDDDMDDLFGSDDEDDGEKE